jgi:phosphoglycerate kinase
VNDAFGTAHRAHSSMVGVDLKVRAAGHLLTKELEAFAKVMEKPERPLLVIMGGAKVKDKIQIITKMLELVDEMIIGGGMTFTFQKVHDKMEIGDSIFDADGAKIVEDILKKAKERNVKMHFPLDFRCGDKFDKDANLRICNAKDGIPKGWRGLDNGPDTEAYYTDVIKRARTVLWNGPQGVSEFPAFRHSSLRMLENLMEITEAGASTIAGGGETVSLIQTVRGAADKLSHVSTGGGASLELLEGRELPGIAALSDA